MPRTDTNIQTKSSTKKEVISSAIAYLEYEEKGLWDMVEKANHSIKSHHYNAKEVTQWFSEGYCQKYNIPWKRKTSFITKEGRYTSHNSFMTVVRNKIIPIALREDYDSWRHSGKTVHDVLTEIQNLDKRLKKMSKKSHTSHVAEGREVAKGKLGVPGNILAERFDKRQLRKLEQEDYQMQLKKDAEEMTVNADIYVKAIEIPEEKEEKDVEEEPTSWTAPLENEDVQWIRGCRKICRQSPELFVRMIRSCAKAGYLEVINEDLKKIIS